VRPSLAFALAVVTLGARAQNFVGATGGVATLSADAGRSGSPAVALSQYKPENGATVSVFAGRDFSDWWSGQASYGWNRNAVLLSGSAPSYAYDAPIRAAIHTLVVEAMLYFRPRGDRLRPYLAAGPGAAWLSARPAGPALVRGGGPVPSVSFDAASAALRVSVGIDVRLRAGLALRYSFGETIQRNPLSRELIPAGGRNLASFQNHWGLVWRF
jgi:hypothetical protein